MVESEVVMMALKENKKISNDAYLGKLNDIKIRVPAEDIENGVKDCRKIIQDYAKHKGMSVNQLVISLINDSMKKDNYGEEIPTGIRDTKSL